MHFGMGTAKQRSCRNPGVYWGLVNTKIVTAVERTMKALQSTGVLAGVMMTKESRRLA
jgi:hypothetical protein